MRGERPEGTRSRRQGGRRGSRRGSRRPGIVSVLRAAVFPVTGAILLGLGISGLHNEHSLVTRGVPVVARVSATHGYGRDAIQVSYLVHGRPEQGTVMASPSGYQLGETLPVVYDPSDPQVVAMAGALGSTSSAWSEVILGALSLAAIPAAFLISALSARRRRRRRGAAGDLPGG
jgi:Protein of unknown function (DUF3592)